jgi:glycosyltransferase involved in cell wall biosynthesis
MQTPRFSLIVICRNAAKYVVRSLSCIERQDFDLKKVEVVFVDDGSSDFSGDIAARFSNNIPNFKIVSTGAVNGSGCGGARNHGLKAATGEYVWHIDVDDMIAPDALSKIDAALSSFEKKHEKPADVCVLPFKTIRNAGSVCSEEISCPRFSTMEEIACTPETAWSKVLRHEVCIDLPTAVCGQDCVWWPLQVDRCFTGVGVEGNAPLYVYDRTNADSISRTRDWTVSNPRTLEQLAISNEAIGLGLKDRFFSDAFRLLADMYDMRHVLRTPWAKKSLAIRFNLMYTKIMSGRYSY